MVSTVYWNLLSGGDAQGKHGVGITLKQRG